MENKVEEVIVNPEDIDVIGEANGVMWVKEVSTYTQDINLNDILNRYNIDNTGDYPIDPNVVVALEDEGTQLASYLRTCQKLYGSKNAKISKEEVENIPTIVYEYNDLPNSFKDEEDDKERRGKQLESYRIAKTMVNLFKSLKNKVILRMGILKQAYYNIQDLLNKNQNSILALNPGIQERKNKFTQSLKFNQIEPTINQTLLQNDKDERVSSEKDENNTEMIR